MASSSSNVVMPSSSSSSLSHRVMYNKMWEYDVFVCFRGADTRDCFTSHLMEALSSKQIKAFIDDKLDKTESIDELTSVLQRSPLSIVIFSENFADSSWCLDEVATISQSMEQFGHWVLPVFYKVDPSDVAEDSGSYAATIKLKHGTSSVLEDRQRWMDALKAVAKCAGHTSQAIKVDSELVKVIVQDVLKKLVDMSPRVKSDTLIGMDSRVSEVEKLLAMEIDDFRIIGLWGMGGVGKTTLAKTCYQSFVSSGKVVKHHFVQNVNEKYEKQCGIEEMARELYSVLLSENNLCYQNLDIRYRRNRLSRSRVFLVLDNVETLSQLEQLMLGDILNSRNLYAPGSRIIVTTRNRRVLESVEACIYHVECLRSHESLQLFGLHAFRQCLPPDDWSELSGVAVSYCKGSPLALKVLGGALFCRDKGYWESFLCELVKIPNSEIHNVLRSSYNELGIDEKRVFLDIACFIHGQSKSTLIKYLATSRHLAYGVLEDLIDKSLLMCVVTEYGEVIEVHDLFREMAWSIVNEQSNLENRSRLKNCDDIHKLLTIQEGKTWGTFFYNIFHAKEMRSSRATEGLSLDLSGADEMQLEANAFEGMNSLRFLRFFYSGEKYGASKLYVPRGGLDSLPDSLRWLEWEKFPSKTLPSRFSPENLILLAIRHCPTLERCWKVQQNLVNLVVLDFSHCINLVEIPDLSRSPNFECLILEGCKRLIELPSYIEDSDKLVLLDVGDCTSMRHLPPKLNSKILKCVRLSNCPKVIHCPEINSRKLEYLDLMGTPVEALPSAIYNIKQDGTLTLYGNNITSFPMISVSLRSFCLCHTTIRDMDCYDDDHESSLPTFFALILVLNPQLKSLSKNIWKMVSRSLYLEDCPSIKSLPEISQPVDGLTELGIRRCRNLKSLPSGIDQLKSLQELCFLGTAIKSLPYCIQELNQLSRLNLSFNKRLEFIPSNIDKLVKLSFLCLQGCSRIQALPDLPPNLLVFDVSGCKLLQALPSNIGRLRWKHMYFEDCPLLDTNLPKEIVRNFPNHAKLHLDSEGALMYSGSEIPRWFAYKSVNYKNDPFVMLQLPAPFCTSRRLVKGIAYGVVFSSDVDSDAMHVNCDRVIDGYGDASWSSPGFGVGSTQSDNVYIWYEENLLGGTKEGIYEEEASHRLPVSLRFSLQPHEGQDPKKLTKNTKIKRVGVSLLY